MAQIDYKIAPPEAIASDLGHRLEKLRLAQNITQQALAEDAGVSRRTITRMENGEGVTLDTLIRVMRALGAVERLEQLLPDPSVRPIDRIRMQGRERKYARGNPIRRADWSWDDESGQQ